MTSYQRPTAKDLRAAYKATKSIRGTAKLFTLPGGKHVSHETVRRWLADVGVEVRAWTRR